MVGSFLHQGSHQLHWGQPGQTLAGAGFLLWLPPRSPSLPSPEETPRCPLLAALELWPLPQRSAGSAGSTGLTSVHGKAERIGAVVSEVCDTNNCMSTKANKILILETTIILIILTEFQIQHLFNYQNVPFNLT